VKYTINEGKADRIVRITIVAVLVAFALIFAQGAARIFCIVLAAAMGITTLMGWCPLYILFGFSTCGKEDDRQKLSKAPEQNDDGA